MGVVHSTGSDKPVQDSEGRQFLPKQPVRLTIRKPYQKTSENKVHLWIPSDTPQCTVLYRKSPTGMPMRQLPEQLELLALLLAPSAARASVEL